MNSKMHLVVLALVVILQFTGAEEVAPDGTVPVQPLSVVPPEDATGGKGSPVVPPQQQQQQQGGSSPYSGLTGTTTETKHADGSTTTITSFKGQLPQNAFPQFNPNPFFGYPQSVPQYFYPYHPGFNNFQNNQPGQFQQPGQQPQQPGQHPQPGQSQPGPAQPVVNAKNPV